MILVIAEKPDAAQKMAEFLDTVRNCTGYLEGKRYIFTWGLGHLLELAPPEEYTKNKTWNLSDLPIVPNNFFIRPIGDKIGQVRIIQSLVNRNDVNLVINACDPDREGELIFRYIWKYINGSKPVERVWLNTFTKNDVQKAFAGKSQHVIISD
jgi:DNA topoisomerase-3